MRRICTFDELVEVVYEKEDQKTVFHVVAAREQIAYGRDEGHDDGEVVREPRRLLRSWNIVISNAGAPLRSSITLRSGTPAALWTTSNF